MVTDIDLKLVLALQIYEDALCSGCGQQRSQSFSHDIDGEYSVETVECRTCRALEAADQADREAKEPKLGLKRWIRNRRYERG